MPGSYQIAVPVLSDARREGYEIEALRSIDFEAVSIDYLVVEKRRADIQEKIDFMRGKGYDWINIAQRDMLFFKSGVRLS